ncbi:hypothetical protein AOLI_G00166430 [Acnodon oligacanthus]
MRRSGCAAQIQRRRGEEEEEEEEEEEQSCHDDYENPFSLVRQRGRHFTSEMEHATESEAADHRETIYPDSAYGSSAMDTDTEESQTQSSTTLTYDEELMHKTILVGDSGVGKTSLLVQFDQGKFIPGSFSATVGIGFTVSIHPGSSRTGDSYSESRASHRAEAKILLICPAERRLRLQRGMSVFVEGSPSCCPIPPVCGLLPPCPAAAQSASARPGARGSAPVACAPGFSPLRFCRDSGFVSVTGCETVSGAPATSAASEERRMGARRGQESEKQ